MKRVSLFVLLLLVGAGFYKSVFAAPPGIESCGPNPCRGFGQVPLGGPAGPAGPQGRAGRDGTSCSISGTTVTCGNSSTDVGGPGLVYPVPRPPVTIRCPAAYMVDAYGSGPPTPAVLPCFWGTTSPSSARASCTAGDATIGGSTTAGIISVITHDDGRVLRGYVGIADISGDLTVTGIQVGAGTEPGYVDYTATPLAICVNIHCTVNPSDPSCPRR